MTKIIPRITVLILTYNRQHFVERAIKSVLNQTFKDFEIVLVDNGSTDDTPKLFEKYRSNEQIRIFRIEENIGFARGFNYCLDQVKGEWYTMVGDDDEIREDALALLFDVVDKMDPELTAVSSNGLDAETGEYSGTGLDKDQYLPLETIVKKCGGNFWAITKSELIRDKRLNIKLPGLENTLWYKVDAIAKRYYIHQPLITYHSDAGYKVTKHQNINIDIKAKLYEELLAEDFFWEVLKKYNQQQYQIRCLKAICFLKIGNKEQLAKVYKKMLAEDSPGAKHTIASAIISILPPKMLNALVSFFKIVNKGQ